jgi:thiol-disulfide isomerase/thioredoxin
MERLDVICTMRRTTLRVLLRALGILAIALACGCGPPEPEGSTGNGVDTPPPSNGVAQDNRTVTVEPPEVTPSGQSGKAHDFAVSMADGSRLRLKNPPGKPVVLHFWGVWCTYCRKEAPTIDKMYQTYRPKGIEFIAISVGDKPKEVVDYLKTQRMHWNSGIDPKGAIASAYKVRGYPTTILISPTGDIHKVHVGMAKEPAWVELMEELLALRKS